MTMTLIETKTLVSAQASIEFTSIPQNFTDLVFALSLRDTTGSVALGVSINGSFLNLSSRFLQGVGSGTPSSSSGTDISVINTASGRTANTFGSAQIYIPNYASTTTPKSLSIESAEENNATESFMRLTAGLYSSNTAITSLAITSGGGTFAIGSTISLYGILKGSDGIVTTS
jgi:hypothetical protein